MVDCKFCILNEFVKLLVKSFYLVTKKTPSLIIGIYEILLYILCSEFRDIYSVMQSDRNSWEIETFREAITSE